MQVLAAEAMRHAHVLLPSLLDADSAAGRDRLHLALAALLRLRREAAPTAALGAGDALALPSKRYNMVSRCPGVPEIESVSGVSCKRH